MPKFDHPPSEKVNVSNLVLYNDAKVLCMIEETIPYPSNAYGIFVEAFISNLSADEKKIVRKGIHDFHTGKNIALSNSLPFLFGKPAIPPSKRRSIWINNSLEKYPISDRNKGTMI